MSENDIQEIKQSLTEIKSGTQVLLNTTRKHLELYAQQIGDTNELNKQLVELQQRTYQVQRLTMAFTIFAVIGVGAFLLFNLL